MEDKKEQKVIDKQLEYYQEYYKYLKKLFKKAAEIKNGGFNFICTLLRVSGVELGYWDPYLEGEKALNDYSNILRKVSKKGNYYNKVSYRLGLLIYSHAIEMSAPYDILLNLLRCIDGQPYKFLPYYSLIKKDKNNFLKWYMPSPHKKIEYLKKLADKVGEQQLYELINTFYDNRIRNAFYHSDYCLTNNALRIIDGGSAKEISLTAVSEKLTKCFAFYTAFFNVEKEFKLSFKNVNKFHKWPNYEVLELVVDETEGLVGFKVHFSNDTFAHFERRKDKVFGQNYSFGKDDGIELFQGYLDKLKKEWRINGKAFDEDPS